jgi:hypothetical protein
MHDNPGATEEEQELSQTERMHEEEEQRGGHIADEVADDENDNADEE